MNRVKLLLLAFIIAAQFCVPLLCAQEVKISVGMSYDQVVEAIRKLGGEDITGRVRQLANPATIWQLDDYTVMVGVGEHYGKLERLSYWVRWTRGDLDGALYPGDTEMPAESLTFDTEHKKFAAVDSPTTPPSFLPPSPTMVQINLLVVSLPTEKALALLPDLRAERKGSAACEHILEMIDRKEARLIGYPCITARSGMRSTTETGVERRVPTCSPPSTYHESPTPSSVVPGGFQRQTIGVTLEVEPLIEPKGKDLELNVVVNHTEFEGFDNYDSTNAVGTAVRLQQPRLRVHRDSTSVFVPSGQWTLLGVHKSPDGEEVELHLIQGTVLPKH